MTCEMRIRRNTTAGVPSDELVREALKLTRIAGLSQREVSKRLGISPPMLSMGQTRKRQAELATLIAGLMGYGLHMSVTAGVATGVFIPLASLDNTLLTSAIPSNRLVEHALGLTKQAGITQRYVSGVLGVSDAAITESKLSIKQADWAAKMSALVGYSLYLFSVENRVFGSFSAV